MVQFRHRSISIQQGVGNRLRVARRSLGLTLDDIAQALCLRRSVLVAVENGGAFYDISEPYYRELILKTYGEYLGIDCGELLEDYHRERVYHKESRQHKKVRPCLERSALWVAPRILKNSILAVIITGICGYVLFLAAVAVQPPRLIVVSPADNSHSQNRTITIHGISSNEASVEINGQQVSNQGDGTFHQEVTLSNGLNIITISAAKKYSKDTVVMRRVLYDESDSQNKL